MFSTCAIRNAIGSLIMSEGVSSETKRITKRLVWCGCIAGAADGVNTWDTSFDGRECRESSMRFGLIPVSDGKEIIGTNVGVAVFDGGANGFCEGDGRIEMETIYGRAAARDFRAFHGRAHERI